MRSRQAILIVSLSCVLGLVPTATAKDTAEDIVKFLRFQAGETVAYGILEGDRVRQLRGDLFGRWSRTETTRALKDVKILVPTKPSKVMALAGNYRDHLGEDTPVPKNPEPFIKLPSCLQRHEGEIVQPKGHEPVHYEAEVVVVIGKRARNVSKANALDYVLGITCGNDISARTWQQGGHAVVAGEGLRHLRPLRAPTSSAVSTTTT